MQKDELIIQLLKIGLFSVVELRGSFQTAAALNSGVHGWQERPR
jgi:hypothetical protein